MRSRLFDRFVGRLNRWVFVVDLCLPLVEVGRLQPERTNVWVGVNLRGMLSAAFFDCAPYPAWVGTLEYELYAEPLPLEMPPSPAEFPGDRCDETSLADVRSAGGESAGGEQASAHGLSGRFDLRTSEVIAAIVSFVIVPLGNGGGGGGTGIPFDLTFGRVITDFAAGGGVFLELFSLLYLSDFEPPKAIALPSWAIFYKSNFLIISSWF